MSTVSGLSAMMNPGSSMSQPAPTTGKKTDREFERSFADLASSIMQDKAPQLMDRMIGFQIIDRNEDGTRAVGVFGFRVGTREIYSPVFFLHGELKGPFGLYLKDEDAFVPLDEDWVDSIMSQRPRLLGHTDTLPGRVDLAPDLSALYRSPMEARKFAARLRGTMIGRAMEMFTLPKRGGEVPGLEKIANDLGRSRFSAFLSALREYPRAVEALAKIYKPGTISKLAAEISESRRTSVVEGDETASPPTATDTTKRVKIIDSADDPAAVFLDDADKERLLAGELVIQDFRPGKDKTRVVQYERPKALTNPSGTGLYDVLMSGGGFRKMLVICKPITGTRREFDSSRSLMVDPETGHWRYAWNHSIWTRKQLTTEEWRRWFDQLPDAKSTKLTEDPSDVPIGDPRSDKPRKDDIKSYVLLNTLGSGTAPFTPHDRLERSSGVIELIGSFSSSDYQATEGDYDRASQRLRDSTDWQLHRGLIEYPSGEARILLGGTNNPYPDRVGCTWCFGDNFKRIPVKRTPCYDYNYTPGDLADLYTQLSKVAAQFDRKVVQVTLRNTKRGAWMSTSDGTRTLSMTPSAMLRTLVVKHALDAGDARTLLKRAAEAPDEGAVAVLCYPAWMSKSAGPMLTNTGGGITPPFPPMLTSYDTQQHAVVQYPQTEFTPMVNQPQLPNSLPLAPLDVQQIIRAGESGRKTVMDTAILESLANSMDVGDLVEKYLGDLSLGLDRAGRLLFLFYWHNSQFSERYGSEDMAKMEDAIKNVFKGLGDLVLFMKQKSAIPDRDIEVDLDAVSES